MNQTVNASDTNFRSFNYSTPVNYFKIFYNAAGQFMAFLWDNTKVCMAPLFKRAASSTFVKTAIPTIARAYLLMKETCIVQTYNIIKIISGTISPSLATELSSFGKAMYSLLNNILSTVNQNCQTPILHPALELASEYPLAIASMALSLLYKACTFFKDRKIKNLIAENARLRNQPAA